MTPSTSSALTTALADPLHLFTGTERPIGCVGFDVPLDILLASGRPFAQLPWSADRPTPLADRWLESSFPGWIRSILQAWLSGEFDGFDTVVFSRGDDAAQRLYYYLSELQRRGLAGGPRLHIFDIAKIRRPSSVKHCELAIRHFLHALDIGESSLANGIAAANTQRAHYLQLDAKRAAYGHSYENIARASLLSPCWPTIEQLNLPTAPALRPLVLAGSVPPDDRLHRAVEAAGWNCVGEAHPLALTRHGAPITVAADSAVAALAQHCNAAAGGPRDFGDRAATLLQLATQKQAAAVVLWLTEEDEAPAWHLAHQRTALTAAGIPLLVLTRRRWDAADGAAREIWHFLQDIAA